MAINSKQKGNRGERYFVDRLKEAFPGKDIKRNLNQVRNNSESEKSDILGLDRWHCEVKCGKQPNVRKALRQAIADNAATQDASRPVVFIKDDRADPFVVLLLEDFIALLKGQ